jgi:ATP-dependent Lon protease
MAEKKNKLEKHSISVVLLLNKKIEFFQDVIQKTILNVNKNKIYDILDISDVNICMQCLNDLSDKIKLFMRNIQSVTSDTLINNLQSISNDLSGILKSYGTESLEDLLAVCFGPNISYHSSSSQNEDSKFELLKKYFHPTGYKLVNLKNDDSNQDDKISEKTKNMECFDLAFSAKQFHSKVYGIKVFFHNSSSKKNLMIYGILDDVIIDFLTNEYLHNKIKLINENKPKDPEFHNEKFESYMSTLNLKDYLTSGSSELCNKYVGFLSNLNLLKQRAVSVIIRDFIQSDLYSKRVLLIQLLIKTSKSYDNQYLAYLLYDLLSNDSNGNIDTQEQTILFDSFPWSIKKYFGDAMKRTIQYTNDLANFDMNKIPLEQQICLLKANDSVKEKAMMKLKEVKAKSEDSGSKARQYLDGLLKIPFCVYKKEPILEIIPSIRNLFVEVVKTKEIQEKMGITGELKTSYTSIEVVKHVSKYQGFLNSKSVKENFLKIKKVFLNGDKCKLISNMSKINDFIKCENLAESLNILKMVYSGKTKTQIKKDIEDALLLIFEQKPDSVGKLLTLVYMGEFDEEKNIKKITDGLSLIERYISDVKNVLDSAVHGHDKAKTQIERIIGQWINGEQDGYCFGFEGPPGCGKTSLAKKGLANCLKDENGTSRPFSMIQMGGDSNGSTLHGHNYTYVGSTWGSIVQILIDKKCMNPIIFIDEIDKISKTEHGREIIGILTHLLDPAQNDCFQDKYFTGIDLDLSKALFVLSYNDPDLIDKILLDRIHRIKFESLSLEDKLVVANTHILPEVYKKMGLEGIIHICEDSLKFIIENYTCEPGVRKLKQLLFELVGDINLEVLKKSSYSGDIPIYISKNDVKQKYFKDKTSLKSKKIYNEDRVGYINGMWANSVGQGGVIPIQVKYYPADKFLNLKLTGMQGDVMKESMNVALTLAWDLTAKEIKEDIKREHFDILSGVHIHCPEGSVPKDGPSAGAAITSSIYSLFNNKKIRHDVAITGEISLDGFITEIGGLDLKILGGIKAGIKEFIYPNDNKKEFDSFIEKYKNSDELLDVKFNPVSRIEEVFQIIF